MAISQESGLRRTLRGGLGKGMAAVVQPDESVLVSLEGGPGEALVLTDRRVLLIKAGFIAGAPFGPRVASFPNATMVEVDVLCGRG